jgi:hypothetical protein
VHPVGCCLLRRFPALLTKLAVGRELAKFDIQSNFTQTHRPLRPAILLRYSATPRGPKLTCNSGSEVYVIPAQAGMTTYLKFPELHQKPRKARRATEENYGIYIASYAAAVSFLSSAGHKKCGCPGVPFLLVLFSLGKQRQKRFAR